MKNGRLREKYFTEYCIIDPMRRRSVVSAQAPSERIMYEREKTRAEKNNNTWGVPKNGLCSFCGKKAPGKDTKKMNKTIECIIKCPFYQSEKEKYITCEGFIKNTCMVTQFPDAKHKREHIKNNCSLENGGRCPMAQNLFAKYGMLDLLRDIG